LKRTAPAVTAGMPALLMAGPIRVAIWAIALSVQITRIAWEAPPRTAVQQPTKPQSPLPATIPTAVVKRVIDGDTVELITGEKIRLIGVDTPETKDPRKPVQYFGQEATAFTQRLVEGKRVRLEYDQPRQDKYGRTLAYMYLEDGTFVNAEIITQGYGFAYTRFPFRYLEEFRTRERQAREAKRGLWDARP
jgi:micrococcal nuclease